MTFSAEHQADLMRLLKLKAVLRTGWTRHPIPVGQVESVADHSYGVMLLSWLMAPDNLDKSKILELGLIHDLAEVETGDLTPEDEVEAGVKMRNERSALNLLTESLGVDDRSQALLIEYQEQQTAEAKWVKKMDRLDMTLQSLIYEQEHDIDLQEFRDSSRSHLKSLGLEWLAEPQANRGKNDPA